MTGRVEYNMAELEEMERLMDMLKGLAKEKKFMTHAWFWWDNFKKYLKNQGSNSTALRSLRKIPLTVILFSVISWLQ